MVLLDGPQLTLKYTFNLCQVAVIGHANIQDRPGKPLRIIRRHMNLPVGYVMHRPAQIPENRDP